MKTRRPFVVVRRKKFVHRKAAVLRLVPPLDAGLPDQSALVLYGQG